MYLLNQCPKLLTVLCSTGYEKMYTKDLCTGTNNDTVTPQIKPNGIYYINAPSPLFCNNNITCRSIADIENVCQCQCHLCWSRSWQWLVLSPSSWPLYLFCPTLWVWRLWNVSAQSYKLLKRQTYYLSRNEKECCCIHQEKGNFVQIVCDGWVWEILNHGSYLVQRWTLHYCDLNYTDSSVSVSVSNIIV